MRAYIVGNVAIDETIAVSELPVIGASILGNAGGSDLGRQGHEPGGRHGPLRRSDNAGSACRQGCEGRYHSPLLADEPLRSELIEMENASSDVSIIFRLPGGENAIVTTTDRRRACPSPMSGGSSRRPAPAIS
ncbi:hypothetical protein [Rhizobium leguminosarum]|uniref:hypothetical protein n=1 Tax=Rhizobium leguminosarum TaxID=384 RepID=UPI000B928735|nr:hypothetical protein CHR56_36500 [Rhizobium leguminosarum bv. viciae]